MTAIKKWDDFCSVYQKHYAVCKTPVEAIGLSGESMRKILIDRKSELRGLTPKQAYAQLAGSVIPYVRIHGYKFVLLKPNADADIAFMHSSGTEQKGPR